MNKFYQPKSRFVLDGEILARVPGRVEKVTADAVHIKMYDLATAKRVPKDQFLTLFEDHLPSPELLADFDVVSYKKAALLSKAGGIPEQMTKAIEKIFMDAYHSCGNAKNCPITDYLELKAKPDSRKKLSSFTPQFNRRARNTFVLPKDFDEVAFQADPAPLGIDRHEYASKAEQNKICSQLIYQLFAFEGAPPMPKALQDYLGLAAAPVPGSHICKYCGNKMVIGEIKQEYKAKEHYMNLCHDDPEKGTRADNLYLGHTSCNREQGGYSMFDRAMKGVGLLGRISLSPEEKAQALAAVRDLLVRLDA